jgi:5-oxoprolinase (ATP-hydrolysing)
MGGTSTDVSRYHQQYEHIFETEISGVSIQAPQLNINTVAAGGGSRLIFERGLYKVGPESAGADPGPVCYRKRGGMLAVTDANLLLGRLLPEYFPHIFGPKENEPLDFNSTKEAFEALTVYVNESTRQQGRPDSSIFDVALGFIRVANEAMCRPIRALTQSRGFNPKLHLLSIFGGAGGQHACAIARELGISKVLIHKYCGILSAYGLGLADVVQEREEPTSEVLGGDDAIKSIHSARFPRMLAENAQALGALGFPNASDIRHNTYLNLRYEGTDTSLMVETPADGDYAEAFRAAHQREFGFWLTKRRILVDNARARSVGKS